MDANPDDLSDWFRAVTSALEDLADGKVQPKYLDVTAREADLLAQLDEIEYLACIQ